MRAFNLGQIDDIVALHAEDVVMMPANMPRQEGREALRRLMTESLRSAPDGFRFEFEAAELRVGEAWAVERGVTRAYTEGASGGVPGGKYVLLYEPDDEGCWRIGWSITNSDARSPAPTGAPDSIAERTIRWTWTEGPTAGVTHEHEFRRDGTVEWRVLSGPQQGHSAVEPAYHAARVSNSVYTVSHLAASGYTLTVVLDFDSGEMQGVASGNGELLPGRGTFEIVRD